MALPKEKRHNAVLLPQKDHNKSKKKVLGNKLKIWGLLDMSLLFIQQTLTSSYYLQVALLRTKGVKVKTGHIVLFVKDFKHSTQQRK